ncbi:(2Fe-2S)-binding protein [Novipirellula artificiosorum]|uniref:Nitrite reductase [NAD(P)H] n=1 Tax=Novipirellula artificiosorum TaxID=2528016 RepID=A0A5C6DWL9_9BACT|nr:(2Fe-2S)-binding protein [Novipirellula artificiosorum]TWU40775.1 Nitrite reductase [NAD(P)H] [Novipirellula artificiosorum]
MKDDDELCICFHVSRRKVVQYIRVEKPSRVSQLSQCFGAGTGCGWCRPYLKQLMQQERPESLELPNAEAYASRRIEYRQQHP